MYELCTYASQIQLYHVAVFIYLYTCILYIRSSHKSAKSDDIKMTETASIQGIPTEVTYAAVSEPSDANVFFDTEMPYAYARTGPVKVR